jgi:hypothetical protein
MALAILRLANSTDTPEWKRDVPDVKRYIKAQQNALGKK